MPTASPSIAKPSGLVRRTEVGTRIATAVLGALLTMLAGRFALSNAGDALVTLSYDLPFIVHRAGGEDDIRMVFLTDLDGQSLDRRPQARLLEKLSEAGARMVVYDLIFDMPSEDPEIDGQFAAAIRRFRGVDDDGDPVDGAPRRHVILGCARDVSHMSGHIMETLVVPNDTLLDAADDFGLVAFEEDAYTIRKLTTGTRDEPSLAWVAAQSAGAGLDDASRMDPRWINFAGPPGEPSSRAGAVPIPSCDAHSVLAGDIADDFFRGKIILVGGQPGIVGQELGKDLFSTPFHRFPVQGKLPYMSGVEIQANALANLLRKNWLTRTPPRVESLLVILAGLLVGAGLTLVRPVNAILAAVGLVVATAAAGVIAIHYGRLWFPWTAVALLQVPVALVWSIASNTYVERYFRIKLTEEQEAIREAFAKYLSPQMLDRLTTEGFQTNLGGEKVEAAMMFTDLESFTDMCERVADPQRIVETLNEYFERTTRGIFEHDGVVIKYVGDAIFAVWGSPLPDPHAAANAAMAAWKLHQTDKLEVDGHQLRTRIGLHFGEVVAGNVGSSNRVDFTMVGDAVNLASRLEGINKMLETSILMSEAHRNHLDGSFRTRRVGRFRVKGRIEPVVIHELLGPARQEDEPAWITTYHDAIAAMEADDTRSALELLDRCESLRSPDGDGPSRFFRERILKDELAPDGIAELSEK